MDGYGREWTASELADWVDDAMIALHERNPAWLERPPGNVHVAMYALVQRWAREHGPSRLEVGWIDGGIEVLAIHRVVDLVNQFAAHACPTMPARGLDLLPVEASLWHGARAVQYCVREGLLTECADGYVRGVVKP